MEINSISGFQSIVTRCCWHFRLFDWGSRSRDFDDDDGGDDGDTLGINNALRPA